MLHIPRVGTLSNQDQVGLWHIRRLLPWLCLRNEQHFLEAYHLKQKSCLVNVSHILLYIGIAQSKLAEFILMWVLEYVLDHSVHNLDTVLGELVSPQRDPHR